MIYISDAFALVGILWVFGYLALCRLDGRKPDYLGLALQTLFMLCLAWLTSPWSPL